MKVEKNGVIRIIEERKSTLFFKAGWVEVKEASTLTHAEENKKFICEKCGKKYKSEKAYYKHIEKCAGGE